MFIINEQIIKNLLDYFINRLISFEFLRCCLKPHDQYIICYPSLISFHYNESCEYDTDSLKPTDCWSNLCTWCMKFSPTKWKPLYCRSSQQSCRQIHIFNLVITISTHIPTSMDINTHLRQKGSLLTHRVPLKRRTHPVIAKVSLNYKSWV